MSLMGSLYIGNSGLQGQQNALNTTAHNMSNAETKGFVRQQVMFGSRDYRTISINTEGLSNQQTGLGVNFVAARQVRDEFLDQQYRKESGRSAFYEVQSEAMFETETLLGEMGETGFSYALNDLWVSTQELVKVPDSTVNQSMFVQNASNFISGAQKVYQGLADYQENLNLQVKQSVEEINAYGNAIVAINNEILKVESSGIERANDLRDQRNLMLDKLGSLADITYKEGLNGSVSVKLEGEAFIMADNINEMKLHQDPKTKMYTPYWANNVKMKTNSQGKEEMDISGAKVFNMQQEASTNLDTNLGTLKSALFARGDHSATYADLLDADHYDINISQSIIMSIQAEFDQLIHGVVTKLNGILADASEKTPDGYLSNEDGTPIQLFVRVSGVAWDTPESLEPNMTETMFSILNIEVNPDLLKTPGKLGFVKPNGEIDQKTVDLLQQAFRDNDYTLNPNTVTKTNFIDYYSSLVSKVGNNGHAYKSLLDGQQQTTAAINNRREQVMGVSVEEEMSNMIRFQNGFNASSRFINAISEMLEHLVTSLG